MKTERKPPGKPRRSGGDAPVSTDADGRVADTKGDAGFRGGQRPDRSGAADGRAFSERGRPRETGRQGS